MSENQGQRVTTDPYEIAKQAMGAIRFYAEYYGSSSNEYKPHFNHVIELLRNKGKHLDKMELAGSGVFLRAFADALQYQRGIPADYKSPFE